MATFFDGRLLTTPTVATAVYDQGMLDRNPAVGNTLAIVGVSTGGKPNHAHSLTDVSTARKTLSGGVLLRAVEMAFSPSGETAGPQHIVAVRIGNPTQATLQLSGSGGGACLNISSTDYGVAANNCTVKVETGTLTGKKLTVTRGTEQYVGDNLAREAFQVSYSGASTSGTVVITDAVIAMELHQDPSGSASVDTFNFDAYPTVQDVVNRINNHAGTGWTATVTAGSADKPTAATFDNVAAMQVKSAWGTATQHVQAIADWINSTQEGLIDAERVAASTQPPANGGPTYLSGASDGSPPDGTAWANGLEVLRNEDVQWIVPLSGDSTVWAAVDAHCAYMSTVAKRERRAFVGGDIGVSAATAKTNAALVNSDRVAYCYPGIYHYDSAAIFNLRRPTLYPAYMTAVLLGGAFAGLTPGETMTNKPIKCLGLETTVNAPGDTDELIRAGVLTVYKDHRGALRVARAISTWLNDTRYNRVEVSTGVAVDYVTRSVREALQPYVGRKATPTTLQSVNAMTEGVLYRLAAPEPVGLGMLVGDFEHPPYRNITSSIEGDVLRVSFECSPAIPINYILVSVHITPYSTTISAI
jgi:hypothetical protein